jgi:membrane protease YdiL (CAAX protease family)
VQVFAAGLATALAIAIVFIQPFAGRRRYRALIARVESEPGARLHHYRRGIVGEWLAVLLVVVIGLLAGHTAGSIGLNSPNDATYTEQLIGEVTLLLFVTTVFMRRPQFLDPLRRQAKGFVALLPRTTEERLTFAVLAVTAGICEEILFRGFGFAYVRFLWPGVSDGWLILITSATFGFGHLYQGPRGVILTGLVGGVFSSITLATGSLVPAIIVHAMIDLRILALPDLRAPVAVDPLEPGDAAEPDLQPTPAD